jgi:S-adenosylmethionine:diacylglycerol 3-amino-3-carboxypropyl transferase
LPQNYWSTIAMSVNANLKEKFAKLKYEQLLAEKYFVETCFSKKHESYTSKQKLIDLMFKIKCFR